MRERREYLRIGAQLPVMHRLSGKLLGSTSISEDISAGGVSFALIQRIEPGMSLDLDILLPDFKKPISAKSKVVWQSENDTSSSLRFLVGAEFTDIGNSDRSKIVNYIAQTVKDMSFKKATEVI